jgi:hypothetical protein
MITGICMINFKERSLQVARVNLSFTSLYSFSRVCKITELCLILGMLKALAIAPHTFREVSQRECRYSDRT